MARLRGSRETVERWAFWWLVLVVGTVAFTMAFLGNADFWMRLQDRPAAGTLLC